MVAITSGHQQLHSFNKYLLHVLDMKTQVNQEPHRTHTATQKADFEASNYSEVNWRKRVQVQVLTTYVS